MSMDASHPEEGIVEPDLAKMSWQVIASWKSANRRAFHSGVRAALESGTLTPSEAAKLHDIGGCLHPATPPPDDLFEVLG